MTFEGERVEQDLFRLIVLPKVLNEVFPFRAEKPPKLLQNEPNDCCHTVIERVRSDATDPVTPVAPVTPCGP